MISRIWCSRGVVPSTSRMMAASRRFRAVAVLLMAGMLFAGGNPVLAADNSKKEKSEKKQWGQR